MAQQWVNGPAHIYLGFGSGMGTGGGNVSPEYLGTTEDHVRLDFDDCWRPVMNDLGAGKPFDKSFQGENCVISGDVNRFNMACYKKLADHIAHAEEGRGSWSIGSKGSLLLLENMAITVWIQSPYQQYAAYTQMPKGYRFPGCSLAAPRGLDLGTIPVRARLVFHAIEVYNSTDGSFKLYDHNTDGLPQPD